jgi:acetyl esterase/lipase
MYTKQTYTYKTVQDCHIRADVYRPPGQEQRPAIVWIHGGALIFGNRHMLPAEQAELYLAAGYTVVSIDYRLAPETKLPAIVEDLQDAYEWLREQGPSLFQIDPDRLAVIGHSAGGYLTLMAGLCVQPRPKALVSFYGYGDIVGAWYSRPDPYYSKQPMVSQDVAYRGVGGPVIAGTPLGELWEQRWLFYLFCRQHGLWPKEVTGYDPHTEPQAFEQYCPVRQITKEYPPTLLLHGDKDTDVPFELSKHMAAVLKQHQVPHRLITMEGLGHVFDVYPDSSRPREPIGLKHPRVAEAFDAVLAFLAEQMGG